MKRNRKENKNNNKKGFLLAEETLKIILAVIAIGFLAFLLFSLYRAGSDAADLTIAGDSLTFLTGQINAQKTNFEIYNPEGWSIMSWPYKDKRPLSCSNLGWQNCICICKNPVFILLASPGDYLDNCDDTATRGICTESSFVVMEDGQKQAPININNPPVQIRINYQTKIISKAN